LSGQSNMVGYANIDDTDTNFNLNNSFIICYTCNSNEDWAPLTPGYALNNSQNRFGVELPIAHKMRQMISPDSKLYFLKNAIGATPIAAFNAQNYVLYTNMVKAFSRINDEATDIDHIKAMWLQGEQDSHFPSNTYDDQLSDLLSKWRSNISKNVFVVSGLIKSHLSSKYPDPVNAALQRYTRVLDIWNLLGCNPFVIASCYWEVFFDIVHYNAKGIELLGNQAAIEFLDVNNTCKQEIETCSNDNECCERGGFYKNRCHTSTSPSVCQTCYENVCLFDVPCCDNNKSCQDDDGLFRCKDCYQDSCSSDSPCCDDNKSCQNGECKTCYQDSCLFGSTPCCDNTKICRQTFTIPFSFKCQ
jgi:hypothetical protein